MDVFTGFPKKGLSFLSRLEENNNRDWFEAHGSEYEEYVKEPALAFVRAMGDRLAEIAPSAVADPRINGSVFRIHRDVRFSKDKRPYKTHVGIRFRDSSALESASCTLVFYVELRATEVLIGGGVKALPRELIPEFRSTVDREGSGEELSRSVEALLEKGYSLSGEQLKRVPAPYDREHPRADFLRRKGIFMYRETEVGQVVHDADFVQACLDGFSEVNPVYQWLRKLSLSPGPQARGR